MSIQYTQSVASQEVPPPYQFPGATVTAFVFKAQMAPIQRHCDHVFNLGTDKARGFRYRPAAFWPYATLLCIDYPVMISANTERQFLGGRVQYRDRGTISQREVFVAVPLVRYGVTPASFLGNSAVEWSLPFIAVENPMSASCGREMLGIGKLLGDISLGWSDLEGSFEACVELPGWTLPDTQNPRDARQTKLKFLDIETPPWLPTFRGSRPEGTPWSLLQSREATGAVIESGAFVNFVDDASAGLAPTVMRTISLKQLRDAAAPDKALYQAIVSCRSHYRHVDKFHFYNEEDVKIIFHNVESFRSILGSFLDLPDKIDKDIVELKVEAAFHFTANIDFDQLRIIHTFPVDRGHGLPPIPARDDLISPGLRPWRGLFGPRRSK